MSVTLTKADLDAYRDAMRRLGEDAAAYVADAIDAAGGSVTTARLKAVAVEAIQDTIGMQGEMAQALAGQLFDEICAAGGVDATSLLYEDLIDLDMMARKVGWFARKLVEDDRRSYAADCAALADYYVHRCAYSAQIRNCANNNMRYARVPTGLDTCDFCLMLASRGFVYYSEVSASEGSHMNCDCIVCPGIGGDSATSSMQIEGYDPDMLHDLWRGAVSDRASKRAARNGTSYEVERMRIMDGYQRASRNARRIR